MPARSDEAAGMVTTFDDRETPRSRSPMRKDPFAKQTSSNGSTQEQIRGQQVERRQWKQQEGQLKRRKLAEPMEKRSPPAQIRPDQRKDAHEQKDDEEKNQRAGSANAPVDAADDEPEKIQVRQDHKVDPELLEERAVIEIRQVKIMQFHAPSSRHALEKREEQQEHRCDRADRDRHDRRAQNVNGSATAPAEGKKEGIIQGNNPHNKHDHTDVDPPTGKDRRFSFKELDHEDNDQSEEELDQQSRGQEEPDQWISGVHFHHRADSIHTLSRAFL